MANLERLTDGALPMASALPEFPLNGPRLRQYMQYMWEFLHDTAPEHRSLVWQEWMPRAYDIETDDLMPSVEAGIRNLTLEFCNDQVTS